MLYSKSFNGKHINLRRKKKMKNAKDKTAIMIALFLTLTIAFPLVALPAANAHSPAWNIPSFAYVEVAPSPVGVGQTVQVYIWVDLPMPSAALTNDIRRHGYTLTITKPDGTVETKTWAVISDSTGIEFSTYTPTQVGNYTFKFDYAGQTYTWSGDYQNDTFAAATATTTLTVQQEPVASPVTGYPLPTEYWARPIEGQNTNWYAISSNWLNQPWIRTGATVTGGAGYGRYQPDGIAPNSAHVMWSKALQFGGVVGGNYTQIPGETYYMGGSYNVRFSNAIVMQGYVYYQEPYGNGGSGGDYVAVDIRTGQELWRINCSATGVSLVPTFGYLPSFDSGNQHGVLPNGLLIATQSLGTFPNTITAWRGYDPRTGVLTSMNVTYVPSGTTQAATLAASTGSAVSVAGSQGELLIYTLTNCGSTTVPQYYLSQWNSSDVVGYNNAFTPTNWYSGSVNANVPLTPAKPTTSAGAGNAWNWNGTAWAAVSSMLATSTNPSYDWNVSIPSLSGSVVWNVYRDAYLNDVAIGIQGSLGTGPRTLETGDNVTAISLNPATKGQVLWTKSYPIAPNNETRQIIAVDNIARTFVTEDKETLLLTGYSLADGSQKWTNQRAVVKWDTVREDTLCAYGNLYTAGFDGILYCIDDATGNLEWTYGNGGSGNSTYAGLGTAYGHYPIFVDVIADGKVYLGTTEHSPNSPWYKGSEYRCINATTGTEIWTLTGWGTGMYVGQYDIVADDSFVYLNCYDMQIYTVGKGPSAMTVEAPMADITQGSGLVIRGTVLDVSAGTQQSTVKADFPYGVPAVSDASMSQWMEYVYMQKPEPTNATGVPVSIDVIDANGNYRNIGNTTSDASGTFSLQWTPDIPGKYTVIATFAGSESYWPSYAETSFAVDPAAPTASPYPVTVLPPTEMYFTISAVAIIIAIVIIGALIMLMLRKRP
jgi:outer membrane protein assembly factor BamB